MAVAKLFRNSFHSAVVCKALIIGIRTGDEIPVKYGSEIETGGLNCAVISATARPDSAVELHLQKWIIGLMEWWSNGQKLVRASGNAPDPGTHLVRFRL
jgi:hypothetical protein